MERIFPVINICKQRRSASGCVGLYGMLQSMQYTGNWAGMFAAVIIVFLPTFILYIFLSEKIIGGVTGGIKASRLNITYIFISLEVEQ